MKKIAGLFVLLAGIGAHGVRQGDVYFNLDGKKCSVTQDYLSKNSSLITRINFLEPESENHAFCKSLFEQIISKDQNQLEKAFEQNKKKFKERLVLFQHVHVPFSNIFILLNNIIGDPRTESEKVQAFNPTSTEETRMKNYILNYFKGFLEMEELLKNFEKPSGLQEEQNKDES